MGILGKCGHCGKSIGESKKTCGATIAVCRICKLPLHPNCLGEHRLMHNNQNYYAKKLSKKEDVSIFSKISRSVRNLIFSKK